MELWFQRNESSGSRHRAIVLQISRGSNQCYKSGGSLGMEGTLSFHPGGSQAEWVQSYHYAHGKDSHQDTDKTKPDSKSVTYSWQEKKDKMLI